MNINVFKGMLDIIQVFQDEGFELNRQGGDVYTTRCYRGHESKSGKSFQISADKQLYRCWNCGVSGDVITFIEDYRNLEFKDAVLYLANKYNIDVDLHEQQERIIKVPYAEMQKVFVDVYNHEKAEVLRRQIFSYLRSHRITPSATEEYKLGVITDKALKYIRKNIATDEQLEQAGFIKDGRLVQVGARLTVPITYRGKLIGWSMRTLDKSERKFLTIINKKIDKRKVFVYLDDIPSREVVVVTEGVFDAIRIKQAGFPAVCTLGLGGDFTQLQNFKKIVLFYDGDTAGMNAEEKVFFEYFPKLNIMSANNRTEKDPCDMDDTLLGGAIEGAINTLQRLCNVRCAYKVPLHDRVLSAHRLLEQLNTEELEPLKQIVYRAVSMHSFRDLWSKLEDKIREELNRG